MYQNGSQIIHFNVTRHKSKYILSIHYYVIHKYKLYAFSTIIKNYLHF